MPFKSKWTADYPICSLPTLAFESPRANLSNDPLLIDADNPDHFLSRSTYRLVSQRLAAGLVDNGFREGDRLLLFSGNNIYFPTVMMGTMMAGGVFTGANPNYLARELAFQLQDSEAKYLICSTTSLEVGLDAARQVGIPREHVFYFTNSAEPAEPQKGCKHWSALLASEEEGRKYSWYQCQTREDMNRTIALNYSSGTTGTPKGVEITHKNYVSSTTTQIFFMNLKENTPEQLATARQLCFLPMYHAMAQTIFGVTGPVRGMQVYVMAKFDFVKMVENIERFRISHLVLVPPIVIALAKNPEVRRWRWDISSIRDILCGAAPLGRPESELFETLFVGKPQEKTINVRQAWGMTELTCIATQADPRKFHMTNSVGELVPGAEACIMKEDGTGEAGRNERGEIWIRGPTVMKGYWRNQRATNETLTDDGWLKSGDIAYVNENGDLFVVDRRKELIKVKGYQVAPAELESILQNHPAINDAAVIGVPYQGDEAPRAYIVLNRGHSISANTIAQWMNEKVSKTKRLRGGVRFIDEIPKNPSGKILRRQLRDRAAKENSQEAAL